MIIGLTGLKAVGKDTAADYLVGLGFVKISFGDAIYDEIAGNFNVSTAYLRDRNSKNVPQARLALVHCLDQDFVRFIIAHEMGLPPGCDGSIRPLCSDALLKPRTSNWLAQRWATEYRRHFISNDYWTTKVDQRVAALPRGTHVVLADMRHNPEMVVFDTYRRHNAVVAGGLQSIAFGGVLELTRSGTVHTGHVSDDGLDRAFITATYANDGSTYDLYRAIDNFITKDIQCL